MLESTHLVKLIGNGRSFQGKEIKKGRLRRLAEEKDPKKEETYENEHMCCF